MFLVYSGSSLRGVKRKRLCILLGSSSIIHIFPVIDYFGSKVSSILK
uniref:Uncharacterized protein n=1 Tax=Rhizophora mucronata TaxID=61149 RepID=A0A2P2P507_RHIMU